MLVFRSRPLKRNDFPIVFRINSICECEDMPPQPSKSDLITPMSSITSIIIEEMRDRLDNVHDIYKIRKSNGK